MKNFDYWQKHYESDKLEEFSNNTIGLLWLKTKSISRKELIAEFIIDNNIVLKEMTLGKQFIELFTWLCNDIENSHEILNNYIKVKHGKQVAALDMEQLVSELYKLKNFDWGGDYRNSLDKYLISRYVKVHQSYDTLVSKFDSTIGWAEVRSPSIATDGLPWSAHPIISNLSSKP
jgi:hypothetical protein